MPALALGCGDARHRHHATDGESSPTEFKALLLHPWVGWARPGSGGHSPPTLSMASPMSASGDLKPKAIRVSKRMRVLTDSTRPLDRPCSKLARIPARWSVIDRASLTRSE